jgi:type IV pilus assembly protein PilA
MPRYPSSMMRRLSRRWTDQRGMTLIEIMVVVAVVAVLFAIALPAVNTHVALQELRGAVREVVEVLRDARSAAVDEGVPRYVVFTPPRTYQVWTYEDQPAGGTWVEDERAYELPGSVEFDDADVTFSNATLADEPETGATVPDNAAYFDTRGAYPYHSSLPSTYTLTLHGGLDRTEILTLHTSTGQVTGL